MGAKTNKLTLTFEYVTFKRDPLLSRTKPTENIEMRTISLLLTVGPKKAIGIIFSLKSSLVTIMQRSIQHLG